MGKRNPVTLVSAVVKRNSAVVTGNLSEANIPPKTISPLPIAIRVMMTCKMVKAPTDIPRIMGIPVVGPLARREVARPCRQLQQGFATSEMGLRAIMGKPAQVGQIRNPISHIGIKLPSTKSSAHSKAAELVVEHVSPEIR
jgi:hypothetical protein